MPVSKLVGILKESHPGERRVALIPASVTALQRLDLALRVESGAGVEAGFPDAAYEQAGAGIAASRDEVLRESEILLQVRTLGANPEAGAADLEALRRDAILVGFAEPLTAHEQTRALAQQGVSLLAMELIPRITRAQSMDALSSMATVAGYKAVLLAADALPRMFPMLMTAAGTVTAARVFVVGAGVAGLQAIATAKRLGAIVRAYDVRPAVKEQVESLGASFVEMDLETERAEGSGGYAKAMGEEFYRRQREMMGEVLESSDVVITTAAVPGKRSPVLLTGEMVARMAPGSVVVDLAAERGGNCELTAPGETREQDGVRILGPANVPSQVPYHASQMYAKNLTTLLQHLVTDGEPVLDSDDEITAGILVTRNGEVVHPQVREAMGATAGAE
ncbi:MAG: Re/Si-specific NAD(P)(+) transhydrogenase subunit alpha [Candidatus Eisenbacteria bacterium]|nr:Re/Si-specific NAD(P)(+) transhydrogenase subunit alpha [Candidatus Eisenbacteria bacterium]